MSEQEQAGHTEDLALDGAESESVIGGHMSPAEHQHEIARLVKEGFVEEACTTEGTLMFNPHTKRHVTVRM